MSAIPPLDAHVLVIEDEPRLAGVLRDYLHAAGCTTAWEADGAAALAAFDREHPDLVLLDLTLPHRDGTALCADIRAVSAVPIIMVTARVDEVDRLLGLELGADDYICKPFSPREAVARVKAVLRRHRQPAAQQTGGLRIDEANCRIAWHGHGLDLTPVEFRLLRTLAVTPLRVWSRDSLMDHLYPDHRIVTDRTVDSHVRNLRRKLIEAGAEGDPIRSIYGIGYQLDL
ncbi:response regulator [Comamonadaceae bacterium PP-2]